MTDTLLDRPTATLEEILSQPACWAECIRILEGDGILQKIAARVPADGDWLFIGCGSSYYIAQSAAATFAAITGMLARAVPASEILLFPALNLHKRRTCIPVLISRSGRTTEVVRAAEYLERERGIRTIAVTCDSAASLARVSQFTIALDPAAEKSTVMTRSFSSMLLALQFLASYVANHSGLRTALKKLPSSSVPLFDQLPMRLRRFVAEHTFDDFIFLGQGPFYGVAREATLKVMEMSSTYGQTFHSLEFRHGPKSVVNPKALIGIFLSDEGYKAEADLLEEVKGLGGTTMAVTKSADDKVRANTDFLVEVPAEAPECSRLAACIPWAQLLGVYTAHKKGMNPDSPRNLTQVVVLD